MKSNQALSSLDISQNFEKVIEGKYRFGSWQNLIFVQTISNFHPKLSLKTFTQNFHTKFAKNI